MKKLLSVCFILLMFFAANAQTNLYVDSSVSSSGSGTTWPTAYKTLSEALNFAGSPGATASYIINVAKGTYFPTGVQNSSNRDSSFSIRKGGIKILGGFPSGGGVRNIIANKTMLSGAIGSAADSDNSRHIMLIASVDSTADSLTMDGLNFVSGRSTANVLTADAGGGLLLYLNNSRKIQISNCSFRSNYAGSGGGLANFSAYLEVNNCVFEQNTAALYGGGFSGTGTTKISNSQFINNVAGDSLSFYYGSQAAQGGAYNGGVADSIYNCSFSGNTVYGEGGGYYSHVTTVPSGILKGCTFSGNNARTYGGAASLGHISIDSCTFTGNTVFNAAATTGIINSGGGIFIRLSEIITGPNTSVPSNIFITRSSFTGNAAKNGGAVYAMTSGSVLSRGSKINFVQSSFSGNTGNNGGALATDYYLYCYLDHCILAGNSAVSGGAVNESGSSTWISNCGFWGNKATSYGGAIYSNQSFNSITFTTFAGDTAIVAGTTLYPVNNQDIDSIQNSIVWDGGTFNIYQQYANVKYSIVRNGFTGTAILNTNPLFINPLPGSSAPTTLGNYQLQACSPAINAGYNGMASYSGVVDLAAASRMYAGTVDMGAYEYHGLAALPLNGPDSMCVNNAAQFTASMSGGTWSTSAPSVATVNNNGVVATVGAGNVVITYTVNTGTCIKNIQQHIYVTAIDKSVGQNGAVLHANQSGASYQWINCNGNMPVVGQTGQNLIVTTDGQYAVIIKKGTCTDTSQCVLVSDVGVASVNGTFVAEVYPNPANNILQIKTADVLKSIRITDITGRQMLMVNPSEMYIQLDVSGLSTGIYLLNLVTAEGVKQTVRVSVVK